MVNVTRRVRAIFALRGGGRDRLGPRPAARAPREIQLEFDLGLERQEK
jgi:hypothetical protein